MQKVFKCIQVYFNRVSVGEDASVVVRESEVLNICAEIFFNVYKFNFIRVSVGEDASVVVKESEVLNFIGRSEKWDVDVCPVKKLVRKDNTKVLEASLERESPSTSFLKRGVTPHSIEEARIFTWQGIKNKKSRNCQQ